MKTFIWDPRFVTGLETVDQQHHRLVDLINQLGEYMVTDRSETGLEVFPPADRLCRYHFAEEEQSCRDWLDLRFVEPHVKRHHEFIASAIWRSQGEAHHTSEVLNDSLSPGSLSIFSARIADDAADRAGATGNRRQLLLRWKRS